MQPYFRNISIKSHTINQYTIKLNRVDHTCGVSPRVDTFSRSAHSVTSPVKSQRSRSVYKTENLCEALSKWIGNSVSVRRKQRDKCRVESNPQVEIRGDGLLSAVPVNQLTHGNKSKLSFESEAASDVMEKANDLYTITLRKSPTGTDPCSNSFMEYPLCNGSDCKRRLLTDYYTFICQIPSHRTSGEMTLIS